MTGQQSCFDSSGQADQQVALECCALAHVGAERVDVVDDQRGEERSGDDADRGRDHCIVCLGGVAGQLSQAARRHPTELGWAAA